MIYVNFPGVIVGMTAPAAEKCEDSEDFLMDSMPSEFQDCYHVESLPSWGLGLL